MIKSYVKIKYSVAGFKVTLVEKYRMKDCYLQFVRAQDFLFL